MHMINGFADFLSNVPLWTAFVAFITAQLIKLCLYYLSGKKRAISLFGSGGMPSSHSASVTALSFSVGFNHGFGSVAFSVAAIFAAIVMYDAANVRQATGKNAEAINFIVDLLKKSFSDKVIDYKLLKTTLGHNRLEVCGGFLWGMLIAMGQFFLLRR